MNKLINYRYETSVLTKYGSQLLSENKGPNKERFAVDPNELTCKSVRVLFASLNENSLERGAYTSKRWFFTTKNGDSVPLIAEKQDKVSYLQSVLRAYAASPVEGDGDEVDDKTLNDAAETICTFLDSAWPAFSDSLTYRSTSSTTNGAQERLNEKIRVLFETFSNGTGEYKSKRLFSKVFLTLLEGGTEADRERHNETVTGLEKIQENSSFDSNQIEIEESGSYNTAMTPNELSKKCSEPALSERLRCMERALSERRLEYRESYQSIFFYFTDYITNELGDSSRFDEPISKLIKSTDTNNNNNNVSRLVSCFGFEYVWQCKDMESIIETVIADCFIKKMEHTDRRGRDQDDKTIKSINYIITSNEDKRNNKKDEETDPVERLLKTISPFYEGRLENETEAVSVCIAIRLKAMFETKLRSKEVINYSIVDVLSRIESHSDAKAFRGQITRAYKAILDRELSSSSVFLKNNGTDFLNREFSARLTSIVLDVLTTVQLSPSIVGYNPEHTPDRETGKLLLDRLKKLSLETKLPLEKKLSLESLNTIFRILTEAPCRDIEWVDARTKKLVMMLVTDLGLASRSMPLSKMSVSPPFLNGLREIVLEKSEAFKREQAKWALETGLGKTLLNDIRALKSDNHKNHFYEWNRKVTGVSVYKYEGNSVLLELANIADGYKKSLGCGYYFYSNPFFELKQHIQQSVVVRGSYQLLQKDILAQFEACCTENGETQYNDLRATKKGEEVVPEKELRPMQCVFRLLKEDKLYRAYLLLTDALKRQAMRKEKETEKKSTGWCGYQTREEAPLSFGKWDTFIKILKKASQLEHSSEPFFNRYVSVERVGNIARVQQEPVETVNRNKGVPQNAFDDLDLKDIETGTMRAKRNEIFSNYCREEFKNQTSKGDNTRSTDQTGNVWQCLGIQNLSDDMKRDIEGGIEDVIFLEIDPSQTKEGFVWSVYSRVLTYIETLRQNSYERKPSNAYNFEETRPVSILEPSSSLKKQSLTVDKIDKQDIEVKSDLESRDTPREKSDFRKQSKAYVFEDNQLETKEVNTFEVLGNKQNNMVVSTKINVEQKYQTNLEVDKVNEDEGDTNTINTSLFFSAMGEIYDRAKTRLDYQLKSPRYAQLFYCEQLLEKENPNYKNSIIFFKAVKLSKLSLSSDMLKASFDYEVLDDFNTFKRALRAHINEVLSMNDRLDSDGYMLSRIQSEADMFLGKLREIKGLQLGTKEQISNNFSFLYEGDVELTGASRRDIQRAREKNMDRVVAIMGKTGTITKVERGNVVEKKEKQAFLNNKAKKIQDNWKHYTIRKYGLKYKQLKLKVEEMKWQWHFSQGANRPGIQESFSVGKILLENEARLSEELKCAIEERKDRYQNMGGMERRVEMFEKVLNRKSTIVDQVLMLETPISNLALSVLSPEEKAKLIVFLKKDVSLVQDLFSKIEDIYECNDKVYQNTVSTVLREKKELFKEYATQFSFASGSRWVDLYEKGAWLFEKMTYQDMRTTSTNKSSDVTDTKSSTTMPSHDRGSEKKLRQTGQEFLAFKKDIDALLRIPGIVDRAYRDGIGENVANYLQILEADASNMDKNTIDLRHIEKRDIEFQEIKESTELDSINTNTMSNDDGVDIKEEIEKLEDTIRGTSDSLMRFKLYRWRHVFQMALLADYCQNIETIEESKTNINTGVVKLFLNQLKSMQGYANWITPQTLFSYRSSLAIENMELEPLDSEKVNHVAVKVKHAMDLEKRCVHIQSVLQQWCEQEVKFEKSPVSKIPFFNRLDMEETAFKEFFKSDLFQDILELQFVGQDESLMQHDLTWIETTLLEEKGASSTLSEARARLACLGVYIDFLIQEKSSGESSLKKTLDKKFNKAVSAFLSYISIKAERCYLHNKENTQSDERRLDLSLAELHTDFERLTRYLDRFSGFDESKLPSSIKRANLKKRFEDMVYNFQVSEGRLGEFTGQAVRLKEKYERYILPTEKKGKKGTCIASCLPEATTLEELPNYYTVPFRLLSHISKNIQHVSHGKIVEAFCSRLVHDYLSAVLGCLKHEATIKNKGAVLGILGTGKGPNLLTVLDRNLPDKIRDYVIDSILKQLRSVFSEIGLKEKRGDRKNEGKDSMLYTMTENSMEVDQTLFEVSEDTCIEFVTQDSKSKLLLTHSESIEDGGLFLSCQVGPGWNRYIDEALTKHSSIMKKTFQNNGLNLKLDGLVGVDDVQRNALIWRVMNA